MGVGDSNSGPAPKHDNESPWMTCFIKQQGNTVNASVLSWVGLVYSWSFSHIPETFCKDSGTSNNKNLLIRYGTDFLIVTAVTVAGHVLLKGNFTTMTKITLPLSHLLVCSTAICDKTVQAEIIRTISCYACE